MTTQHTDDRADPELRTLLADADPAAPTDDATDATPAGLLARILTQIGANDPTERDAATSSTAPRPPGEPRTYPRRHWQGLLWAAASVATMALAAATLLPGLLGGTTSDGTSIAVSDAPVAVEGATGAADSAGADLAVAAPDGAARSDPQAATTAGSGTTAASGTVTGTTAPAPALARSATVLVGTDDIDGARDRFVAQINALGGRVMSESVVTEDGGGTPTTATADSRVSSDIMYPGPYPYPWYPSGPGVWLSVEVPVADYDRAVAAAQATGQVVRLEQSTTDVTAQQADVDARIAALDASLARLTALLGQATGISDVVALEDAIASRQAELDSLRAQQSDLASQTKMSRVSLTLMSPEDATASTSPEPGTTWWDSLLVGLEQMWTWLGTALLIVSPLLLAGAIVAWARRRRHRSADSHADPKRDTP